ncbi:MAG: transposase [Planctomycetaceae bacterium]
MFAHVQDQRATAAKDDATLRISLDTKAKVKIGEFSRGGQARGATATRAADHDMGSQSTLVPLGILEVSRGAERIDQLWLGFGESRETSDFIADALQAWWSERGSLHPNVRRLHVELDNGPEINSSRTQFMKRLVDFSDESGLEIELVYFPPYHSKYNPIERCWGVLERHWNGTLLSSIETALNWAATMTWRGIRPIIHRLEGEYDRGVRIARTAYRPIAERLHRSETLPKWSLAITPVTR